MKIVVLDGYTENPGDLSWGGFEALGEFTCYDRTPADLTVERIGDAEIVITNKTLINRVGHGIGYMIHEAPDIKECNPRRLERGMCFSIEPGVYLANVYGMRIENIVAINEKGETEILNKVTRELTIIK